MIKSRSLRQLLTKRFHPVVLLLILMVLLLVSVWALNSYKNQIISYYDQIDQTVANTPVALPKPETILTVEGSPPPVEQPPVRASSPAKSRFRPGNSTSEPPAPAQTAAPAVEHEDDKPGSDKPDRKPKPELPCSLGLC